METTTNQPAVQEDKTVAIIAYLTLIGFIIAIIMHGNNKTKLGAFHLRQVLCLLIVGIGSWIVSMILAMVPFVGLIFLFVMPFVGLGMLVLVILGIINASNGQEKPLPLIGGLADKFFPTAFA